MLRIASALALAAGSLGLATTANVATATAGTVSDTGVHTTCIGHHFKYSEEIEIHYANGCTGHDEPELDPISNEPGSAKNLTWTVILPSDGSQPVSSLLLPWWGGTVTDKNSLFHQAFEELQFYPDTVVTACTSDGNFIYGAQVPNAYTACSPVWQVIKKHGQYIENAAFNDMLRAGNTDQPLIMHGGDTVKIAFSETAAQDGWHIDVKDLTTHGKGSLVLNSQKNGPLNAAYDTQQIGNNLKWGAVYDTPASMVWEIGHSSLYGTPPGQFCLPGNTICDNYDAAHWAATSPLRIVSVQFAHSKATTWGTVSDYGGVDEIRQYCKIYGKPYCTYPWFAWDGKRFTYGVNFPGTKRDFGKAAQFQTEPACDGPFGQNSLYCTTVIKQPKS
jgi:hypothetical protein